MFQMQDPAQAMLLQTFMQGMNNFGAARQQMGDTTAFNNWLSQNQGLSPFGGDQQGPMSPFPQMRSPFGQQMQANYMQGQMGARMPLNPLEEAQRQRLMAEAESARAPAYAQSPRMIREGDPSGLPKGMVTQEDRFGNVQILHTPPLADLEKQKKAKALVDLINASYKKGPMGEMLGEITTGLEPIVEEAKKDLRKLYGVSEAGAAPGGDDQSWSLDEIMPRLPPPLRAEVERARAAGEPTEQIMDSKAIQDFMKKGMSALPPMMRRAIFKAKTSNDLTKLNEIEKFSVPVPKIVGQYPRLAEKMPKMTPEERAAITSAIQGGMGEAEILKFVR